MIASGQYKNTLLLYLNFDEISALVNSPAKFYSAIISRLFDALLAQWPLMKQFPEKQRRGSSMLNEFEYARSQFQNHGFHVGNFYVGNILWILFTSHKRVEISG